MIKRKGKETLAEKISGILSTAPSTFDPEDDTDNQTSAKLLEDTIEDDDEALDEQLLSKFRKQNIDLLGDVDERYAGRKGSRKALDSEEEDGVSSEEQQSDDNDEDIDSEGNLDEVEDEEDSEEADEEDDDEEEDSEDEEGIDLEDYQQEESNFSHFKDSDVSAQVKKGLCVRNQMSMWESLLEMRIQLQKCLLTANKMPQKQSFKDFKNQDQDFNTKVSETSTNLCGVLDKLLQFQKLVLKKYPETKNLDKADDKKDKSIDDEDNEEIPSDTEDEMEQNQSDEEEIEEPKLKKRKLSDYEQELDNLHNKYRTYRNNVIQKWNEKTRIAVAKNNSQTHSVLNQIQHNLSDKSRLVKRTQLKRSDYKILGLQEETQQQEANEDNIETKQVEEYNTEIYDDDDFYHQLLRELIEVKSADITDPVQLGRQWIQLQSLRSKMKRKIDTKATKGRKIRYAVHTKLVNFMAPIDENQWTDEAKTELYNSLFGKKV